MSKSTLYKLSYYQLETISNDSNTLIVSRETGLGDLALIKAPGEEDIDLFTAVRLTKHALRLGHV